MVVVKLQGLLAGEAGTRRLEVDAATLTEALRALPVAGLVLDEHGVMRPLVNVYVNGERERDPTAALAADAEILIVAAVAGGAGAVGEDRSPAEP